MRHFKDVYSKNTIIQFLISYILVFIIPLMTLAYGFQSAFKIVESEINRSSMFVLEQGINQIDEELSVIRSMALQMSQSQNLKELASNTNIDAKYIEKVTGAIEEYYGNMRYQRINLVGDTYIYLKNRNRVLYENTIYRFEVFEKYLKLWGINENEYETLFEDEVKGEPRFVVTENYTIHYIVPFYKTLQGEYLGSIIYRLSNDVIHKYLGFLDEYEQYDMFIIGTDGEVMWSEDQLGYRESLDQEWLTGHGNAKSQGKQITYTNSKISGWQYVLVLPNQIAFSQLEGLKSFVGLIVSIASILGLGLSAILAIRKGRPINELFKVFERPDKEVRLENMGEIVTQIVMDHDNLLEEITRDKPALQKAFFHNLIKAEFINSTELDYMAQKAGIVLKGSSYYVVSFKLFAHNDCDIIDVQTIEDVRVVAQIVMNYIQEHYSRSVWFYKRNTLVTVGIFEAEDEIQEIKRVIEKTRDWLNHEYSVETSWGLSSSCKNLMEIWRNCMEADLAMESCQDNRHVIEYTANLECEDAFYLPYIAEEKLMTGMRSGDWAAVENILNILYEENFVKRALDRARFIKFNRRMLELLAQYARSYQEIMDKVAWINEMVISYQGESEEYFRRLKVSCQEVCNLEFNKKSIQRKKVIENIMEYIRNNYMDSDLSLGKIGGEFGMSEGYLSTIFKEGAGVNFTEFLEQIRIERACLLLKDDTDLISNIAEQVGYNSIQSFRRAFKRVMGVAPKEYREIS